MCDDTRLLQRVVACCSVLQCGEVCCSVLQCGEVCCSVLQCVAVCCSVLQCVAVCCSASQCVAVRRSVLQCVAVPYLHSAVRTYDIQICVTVLQWRTTWWRGVTGCLILIAHFSQMSPRITLFSTKEV